MQVDFQLVKQLWHDFLLLILPFIITALLIIHLFLIEAGSNDTSGINSDKTQFFPHYTLRDILGVLLILNITNFSFILSRVIGDAENYLSHAHLTLLYIKPEYFIFAYAILLSTPHKLERIQASVFSILTLAVTPILHASKQWSITFGPLSLNAYLNSSTKFACADMDWRPSSRIFTYYYWSMSTELIFFYYSNLYTINKALRK